MICMSEKVKNCKSYTYTTPRFLTDLTFSFFLLHSVKAVFSLARRLSPCVVFLDEVDALFGARISRGSSGSMSHNLILTEFMQEMDGLSSAIANKDKRVVVIGATNRPFDLDDAVMRRLPRRLLVDLPGVEDRKGECKTLCAIARFIRQTTDALFFFSFKRFLKFC